MNPVLGARLDHSWIALGKLLNPMRLCIISTRGIACFKPLGAIAMATPGLRPRRTLTHRRIRVTMTAPVVDLNSLPEHGKTKSGSNEWK